MKTLVVYFSAEGTTKKVAEEFAKDNNFETFEIIPENPYSKADIKWTNPLARCNKEKFMKKNVPVKSKINDFAGYNRIFLGFPIWYYGAPNGVNTFCNEYDWSGKSVVVFATSGGSPIGKTAEKLQPYLKNVKSLDAVLIKTADEIKKYL